MEAVNERTELLINRRLDGRITPDESLELDKALIRTPAARDLLADYERIDAAAAAGLRAAIGFGGTTALATRFENAAPPRSRATPWRSLAGLAAGFVLAVTLAGLPARLTRPEAASSIRPDVNLAQPEAPRAGFRPVAVQTGPHGARTQLNSLDREVIGVFDERSGSVYLLEIDRSRSQVVPVRANY